MVGRVIADDVDHGRVGATSVVKIRPSVGEAGPEVQECGGGGAPYSSIPIGSARCDTFEEAKDRPHLARVVEAGDKMHLRSSGVGETGVDTVCGESREERVGTVHGMGLSSSRRYGLSSWAGSKACLIRR